MLYLLAHHVKARYGNITLKIRTRYTTPNPHLLQAVTSKLR